MLFKLDKKTYCKRKLQFLLINSFKIIRMYDWIIDAYVLDFYTDNHWDKLPESWKKIFFHISPMQLSNILQQFYQYMDQDDDDNDNENEHMKHTNNNNESNNDQQNCVWPLSLLALKNLLKQLCVPRNITKKKNQNIINNNSNDYNYIVMHPKLRNLFTKCVKPKKRHEIENMAKTCFDIANNLKVQYIVDFGSGLGHLARTLFYGYDLNVCCLEMESNLNEQARLIDQQFEKTANKYLKNCKEKFLKRPKHITVKLTKQTTSNEFLLMIKSAFNIIKNDNNNSKTATSSTDNSNINNNNNNENFKFGIIGLHPCGDLSSILIDLFLKCDEAKFLNLVGCCYMKLTTTTIITTDCEKTNIKNPIKTDIHNNINVINDNKTKNESTTSINNNNYYGYPLCKFLNEKNEKYFYKLSYESREIACHAIEMYLKRLKKGYYDDLKVHSYRAALEKIIIKHYPEYKHSGLRNVKHTNSLTFEGYCEKALKGLSINVPLDEISSDTTHKDLEQWKNVVIFYTLRLIFAPLIESIVLYDRILYLQENDCNVIVDAIFDPLISPRNHLTIAIKNS